MAATSRKKPDSLVQMRPLADLIRDPGNARKHSPEQIRQIAVSIETFGWTMPAISDEVIRAGNGRHEAAELIYAEGGIIYLAPGKENGGTAIPEGTMPVIDCTGWPEAMRRAYALADNQIALNSEWDEDRLMAELRAISEAGLDLGPIGFDPDEIARILAVGAGGEPGAGGQGPKLGGLTGEFLIAPFSVLNAREGWWQDRKRQWLGMGIESEVGRGANLIGRSLADRLCLIIPGQYQVAATFIAERRAREMDDQAIWDDAVRLHGKATGSLNYGTQNWVAKLGDGGGLSANQSGTSIFDPVLCELAYRWFSPDGGLVLDPFAGGSVRGIVAGKLGRRYLGIDLRPEQVQANEEQGRKIVAAGEPMPEWHAGNSATDIAPALNAIGGPDVDFIFSCPPYGDLEVYSDDPLDLSTMDQDEFIAAYEIIIEQAVACLKPDRFACFVVGDYRDRQGFYRNFVSATIQAFERAGARLYNEAILVTSVGSLPIRAAKQFRTTRKLGKTHQNILVFCKGDPRKATEACGPVDVSQSLAMWGEIADEPPALGADLGPGEIKISAAMARLMFIECGPACIASGCHGNCCDAPSRPTGCMITINPDEQARIEALGGVVEAGLLLPRPGEKGCPFKAEGLCGLHASGEKPWGCIASPFTLNPKGTLIVRNRYRLLPCYKNEGEKAPAYRTFRSSLEIIFGLEETARIIAHLDAGGGDLIASCEPAIKAKLFANDAIKKEAKEALGGEV